MPRPNNQSVVVRERTSRPMGHHEQLRTVAVDAEAPHRPRQTPAPRRASRQRLEGRVHSRQVARGARKSTRTSHYEIISSHLRCIASVLSRPKEIAALGEVSRIIFIEKAYLNYHYHYH